MINRIYDYVSLMLHIGYSLKEIGLIETDMKYLRKAHTMMLAFQEIKYEKLDLIRFGATHEKCDFTYIYNNEFIDSLSRSSTKYIDYFQEIMIKHQVIPYPEERQACARFLNNNIFHKALWLSFSTIERRVSKITDKLLSSVSNPKSILRFSSRHK